MTFMSSETDDLVGQGQICITVCNFTIQAL